MASDELLKRVPPHSIEAERACIGAMMINPLTVNSVMEIIREDDFFDEKNKIVFQVIYELSEKSAPVDPVSVSERLESNGKLERIGGIAYLSQLGESVPSSANIGYYAKIIMEKSILRNLLNASMGIIDNIFENQSNLDKVSDDAERSIFEITGRRLRTEYHILKDAINETLRGIDRIAMSDNIYTGLPTGYEDFDKLTSGLQKGDLIVLAARPSMGKTALALNIAANIAELDENNGIMIFSLEMSFQELVIRMLSSESRIDMQKIRKGQLIRSDSNNEWDILISAADKLRKFKIVVDDTPAISITELRSKARRVVNRYDVKLIIIDHLQLVSGADPSKPSYNRNAEISYISRSLKALAKEMDIPILVLSQLSRNVEGRQDKHPILSDLRESGAIEQDADIVAFLYRDEYYNKEESKKKGLVDLDIKKQRNGPIGNVELGFWKECVKFVNVDVHSSKYPQAGSFEERENNF